MQYGKNLLAAGLLLSLSTVTAQAALQSRAGGTMVYDTDLNITWVADANLFKTQADASGDAAAFVESIITANGGVIHDTPNFFDGNDGVYELRAADFDTGTGRMSWFGAQAWANSLSYGGYSDWRLPNASSATGVGYESSSELGHLFYSELGGVGGNAIPDTATFSNEQVYAYWSGTEYAPAPNYAWHFHTYSGRQDRDGSKGGPSLLHAWAVRPGDVAIVPVPGAVWLFGTGLLGVRGLKRRGGASSNWFVGR